MHICTPFRVRCCQTTAWLKQPHRTLLPATSAHSTMQHYILDTMPVLTVLQPAVTCTKPSLTGKKRQLLVPQGSNKRKSVQVGFTRIAGLCAPMLVPHMLAPCM